MEFIPDSLKQAYNDNSAACKLVAAIVTGFIIALLAVGDPFPQ